MAAPLGPRACSRCGTQQRWRSGSERLCDACLLGLLAANGAHVDAIVMTGSKKRARVACRGCGEPRLIEVAVLLAGRGHYCRSCARRTRTYEERRCQSCGSEFSPGASRTQRCDACEIADARRLGYAAVGFERRGGRPGVVAGCAECGRERFVPLSAVKRAESKRCPACAVRNAERACGSCGTTFVGASASVRRCDRCLLQEARLAGYHAARVARRRGVTGFRAACARCGQDRFVTAYQVRIGAAHCCMRCRA